MEDGTQPLEIWDVPNPLWKLSLEQTRAQQWDVLRINDDEIQIADKINKSLVFY